MSAKEKYYASVFAFFGESEINCVKTYYVLIFSQQENMDKRKRIFRIL